MARRGPRRRLAPNIYQDDAGIAVKVMVAGREREQRFPLGTPLERLEEARDDFRADQRAAKPATEGTLRADVLDYLATIDDDQKRKTLTLLCAHWVAGYGERSRWALTPLVIRQQLATWRRQGVAASTCNHRLSALRGVFRALNQPDEPNYPAQVKKLPEPPAEPRALPYALIARILAAMPDRGRAEKGQTRGAVSLTKLRLSLMAYTGLPPAQIMRIQPETDIDWQTPALRVRPRRKGRGRPETWQPLIPQAVTALRALVAAGALPGAYSNDAVSTSFRRACRTVIAQQIAAGEPPLPHRVDAAGRIIPLVRVYDLRHSWGTLALRVSKRREAVQHLMLHADARQTDRYTLAAIPEAVAEAAAAIGAALADQATLEAGPGAVPDLASERVGHHGRAGRQTSQKTARNPTRARSSAG